MATKTTTTIDVLLMVEESEKAASKKEKPRMNFIDELDIRSLYTYFGLNQTIWKSTQHFYTVCDMANPLVVIRSSVAASLL